MRKAKIISVLLIAALLLTGCRENGGTSSAGETVSFIGAESSAGAAHSGISEENAPYSFTDSLGRSVEVSEFGKTVVLSSSLAEIWELSGGKLFGATADVFDAENITLSENTVNCGDLKTPSAETIIASGAELVILSSAITGHTKLEPTLTAAGITAAYFDIEDFEDYLGMLKICTDINNRPDLYEKNGESVRARVEAAVAKAQGQASPKILLMRAYSTGIKAKGSDNMTGQMLKELGCVNIADSDASLLEELSLEAIIRADPDFVFITTMGEDEAAAVAQYENTLGANPAWQSLSAVKNGEVHILPKDLYHLKPNARWGEAYEKLEEILYE
ncbi:MAG: ABC transporter substrate-binding protein [Oscillospiraceae bacterium]